VRQMLIRHVSVTPRDSLIIVSEATGKNMKTPLNTFVQQNDVHMC
jgi:hypothetical protein